jgi:hypothetical protein
MKAIVSTQDQVQILSVLLFRLLQFIQRKKKETLTLNGHFHKWTVKLVFLLLVVLRADRVKKRVYDELKPSLMVNI